MDFGKGTVLPLPNAVQEQLNEAIGHGFDGMIVYVDEAGKPPAFYTAGWNLSEIVINRIVKILRSKKTN